MDDLRARIRFQWDIRDCRYSTRAAKLIRDSTHPGNCLFGLLQSAERFRGLMVKTESLRRNYFRQAINMDMSSINTL